MFAQLWIGTGPPSDNDHRASVCCGIAYDWVVGMLGCILFPTYFCSTALESWGPRSSHWVDLSAARPDKNATCHIHACVTYTSVTSIMCGYMSHPRAIDSETSQGCCYRASRSGDSDAGAFLRFRSWRSGWHCKPPPSGCMQDFSWDNKATMKRTQANRSRGVQRKSLGHNFNLRYALELVC